MGVFLSSTLLFYIPLLISLSHLMCCFSSVTYKPTQNHRSSLRDSVQLGRLWWMPGEFPENAYILILQMWKKLQAVLLIPELEDVELELVCPDSRFKSRLSSYLEVHCFELKCLPSTSVSIFRNQISVTLEKGFGFLLTTLSIISHSWEFRN